MFYMLKPCSMSYMGEFICGQSVFETMISVFLFQRFCKHLVLKKMTNFSEVYISKIQRFLSASEFQFLIMVRRIFGYFRFIYPQREYVVGNPLIFNTEGKTR